MAIKANNKPLREFDGTVYLPFGTEYTILLKNLHARKARVTVFIDGEDALGGSKLIVDGKSQIELKRFIRNGNLEHGNSFKFIEKTDKVSKHRGDRIDDGLITIHYEFEVQNSVSYSPYIMRNQDRKTVWTTPYPPYNEICRGVATPGYYGNEIWNKTDTPLSSNEPQTVTYSSTTLCNSATNMSVTRSRVSPQAVNTTAGVTAPGTVNDQKFVAASGFYGDGVTHSMTIQLAGETEASKASATPITKPVVVQRRKRCPMCGTNVKQTAKFCHECGSSVDVI